MIDFRTLNRCLVCENKLSVLNDYNQKHNIDLRDSCKGFYCLVCLNCKSFVSRFKINPSEKHYMDSILFDDGYFELKFFYEKDCHSDRELIIDHCSNKKDYLY